MENFLKNFNKSKNKKTLKMMESFHRNASVESEGSSSTDEEFKGFHQYEIKFNNLPRNIRTSVRKLERAYKRLVKVSSKVMFNDLYYNT